MKIWTTPVETIGVGDEATFTWKDGDVTRSAYARVAAVEYFGKTRVLRSDSGAEIARYTTEKPSAVVCVLLHKYVPVEPPLFEYTDSDSVRLV